MPRYTGPGRFTALGGDTQSRSRLAELNSRARKVAGDLQNRVVLGDIWQGKRVVDLGDGAKLIATVDQTYPDNPLVQTRIHLTKKPEREKEEDAFRYELVIVREQFVETGAIDHLLISFSKFEFSATGVLKHLWEHGVLNTSAFHANTVNFTTDQAYGISRTTLYDSGVTGYWDCTTEVPLEPITPHRLLPVGETAAGFGIGRPIGYSGNAIGTYIPTEWPYRVIDNGPCEGTFTLPSGLGPANTYGFHWPNRNMDYGAVAEYEGKYYYVDIGFLDNYDSLIRTRVWEVNDATETGTVIHEKFWPSDYYGGFPHKVQIDSVNGILYVLLDFSGWLVLAKYDIPNGIWSDTIVTGGVPSSKALGFDPATRILVVVDGIWGGSANGYDYTLRSYDPDTLALRWSSKVLNDSALRPYYPDWNPYLEGVAPIGENAKFILATYKSTHINFTNYGRSIQTAFGILKLNEDGIYEVVDVIRRADYDTDHPANRGLNPDYSSTNIFVRPVKYGRFAPADKI